jgi:hypothetical protein
MMIGSVAPGAFDNIKTQEGLDTVLKIFESMMPVEWSEEEKMSFLFPDKPSDLG